MKTIYYTVQKQLNNLDGIEETNGWKDVRAYEVKNGKLEMVCDLEMENSESSERELLNKLESENLIQTKPNLIEL